MPLPLGSLPSFLWGQQEPCREVTCAIADWSSMSLNVSRAQSGYIFWVCRSGTGYLPLVTEGHSVVSHANCSWEAGLEGTNAISMGDLGQISPFNWPQFPPVASAGTVVQTVTAQVEL